MYQFSWEWAIGIFTVFTILALICYLLAPKVSSKIAKREAENTHLQSQIKLAVIPACISLMYWFFLYVCDIFTRCFEGYELGSILSYLGNTGWTISAVALIGSWCFPVLQRKMIGSSDPVYVNQSIDEAVNLLNFVVALSVVSLVSFCKKDFFVGGTILAFVVGHFIRFDKIYIDEESELGKLKSGFKTQPIYISFAVLFLNLIFWPCVYKLSDINSGIVDGISIGLLLSALAIFALMHFDPLKQGSKFTKE